MITLDASVVIAHLYPRDPHHQAATEYLRRSAEQGFVIHSLNLAEVLVGGVKAGRGQEMLTDLQMIGIHVADRPDGEPLRLANLRASSGLKLPDCCALATALATASTLATFDDALAKAARQHHVTVAPDDRNADGLRDSDGGCDAG
ncbi:MAG: type II toxin-antitoxin system VapC family toxin [Pseudonocardiaceae bacterium]